MAVLKQIFALFFLAILVAECVSFAIESRSAPGETAMEVAREARAGSDAATPLDPVAVASGAERPLERETRGLKKKKSKKSHKKHGKKGHGHGGYHG